MNYDCIVDDVPAIMARLPQTVRARHYTTSLVAGEVRDRESSQGLEFMLEAGLLEVRDPRVSHPRIPWRLEARLSQADKSLLALAAELARECGSVAIATDDYALQEAAVRLGFGVLKVRYRGARITQ